MIEYLPNKLKVLNSNPSAAKKKKDIRKKTKQMKRCIG
jgi:hypothetical protein